MRINLNYESSDNGYIPWEVEIRVEIIQQRHPNNTEPSDRTALKNIQSEEILSTSNSLNNGTSNIKAVEKGYLPKEHLEEIAKWAKFLTCKEETLQVGLYWAILTFLESRPFMDNLDDALVMFGLAKYRGKTLQQLNPEDLMADPNVIALFLKYQDENSSWFIDMIDYFHKKPSIEQILFIWNYNHQKLYDHLTL
jgi:hypothetical protein